jgi:hypothetical protein
VVAYYQGYGTSNGDVYGQNRDRRNEDMRRRNDDPRAGVYGNTGVYGNIGQANGGYGNSMLHWTGNVDDQLEIRLQNGRVDYRTLSGNQPTSIRVNNVGSQMPSSNASVSVMQHQGRGQVRIVQQPSARNGYTTVIRVNDPQGGYGFYDFDLVWQ